MEYLLILPHLGLKDNAPADSATNFQMVSDGVIVTHDMGGQNVDYIREKNACNKAFGQQKWDNSANASATKCLGLCELWDGTNLNHIYFDNGACYIYDSSLDPVATADAGATTFAQDNTDLYSIITFGGYMIFADRAEHTPYKWKHGDALLTKLILSGTEYKFRYLMHLSNRIIGAYSDQTNGDLDIRWTSALPTWASLDFAAANQIYKPEGDESITGLGKLGHNTGYVFSDGDITRLDYYGSSTPVFSAVRVVSGWGSVNHHSIVSDGTSLYFFDKRRGFCSYSPGVGVRVVSEDIEDMIGGIRTTYANLIVGVKLATSNEIAWTVPLDSQTTPNAILYYNTATGQWRKETKNARYLDTWKPYSNYTWNNLNTENSNVWPTTQWNYYTAELAALISGNTNGRAYIHSSEQDDTGDYNGYRIEPILPMGKPDIHKRLLEIWVSSATQNDVDLKFYWRGGNTTSEVEASVWTALGTINLNNPTNPVLFTDKTARLHQLKWGTELKDEYFSIPGIKVGYVRQGRY